MGRIIAALGWVGGWHYWQIPTTGYHTMDERDRGRPVMFFASAVRNGRFVPYPYWTYDPIARAWPWMWWPNSVAMGPR